VQVVLQAVDPQTSGVQLCVTAVGQVPVPVQVAATVATPLVQLAARQEVVAGATAQVPLPVQAPVLPQGGAATQRASANPGTSLAQVPAVPPVLAAEHPRQVPVQALLQQTPSTQKAEPHWAAEVQAAPLARQVPPVQATHLPLTHWSPVAQFAAVVQLVVQAVAPQMKGEQVCVTAVGQAPVPLQLAACVATPPVQLAARQDVVVGATAQAPVPVQVPVLPQGGAATQRESAAPPARLVHVPLVPPVLAFEQAVQAPVQAVLQQNPSTQKADVH